MQKIISGTHNTFTYSISTGNSDNIFLVDPNSGVISITDTTNLDYETTALYQLKMYAIDAALTTGSAMVSM